VRFNFAKLKIRWQIVLGFPALQRRQLVWLPHHLSLL
jgi:hypothetical protein